LLLFFLPNSPSSMWFPWGLCLFFFLSFPHGVELTCWFPVFLIQGVFAAVFPWLFGGDPLVFFFGPWGVVVRWASALFLTLTQNGISAHSMSLGCQNKQVLGSKPLECQVKSCGQPSANELEVASGRGANSLSMVLW
jgi:hypothetical protein